VCAPATHQACVHALVYSCTSFSLSYPLHPCRLSGPFCFLTTIPSHMSHGDAKQHLQSYKAPSSQHPIKVGWLMLAARIRNSVPGVPNAVQLQPPSSSYPTGLYCLNLMKQHTQVCLRFFCSTDLSPLPGPTLFEATETIASGHRTRHVPHPTSWFRT